MTKCIISLGSINWKKIILPILLAIDLILIKIFSTFVIPKKTSVTLINNFGCAIGEMSTRILACFYNKKRKKRIHRKNCSSTNIKDYLLFFILYFFFQEMKNLIILIEVNLKITPNLNINLSVEFICLLLLSKWLLKYQYYLHNILCLIIFSLSALTLDLMFENFDGLRFFDLFFYVFYVGEILLLCYFKFLLNKKKFHVYWNLLFFFGLFHFIYLIINLIIDLKFQPDTIKKNFERAETKYIILDFFIYLIFSGFIRRFLIFYIIDILSPDHLLLSFTLNQIAIFLIDSREDEDKSYLYCLIPNFFQILSVLIYLEILELNICNLSKNTRKNIRLRSEVEMNLRDSINSNNGIFDIGYDLVIKSSDILDENDKDKEKDNNENSNKLIE